MNKDYIKSYLYSLESELTTYITQAVLERKPRNVILNAVRRKIQSVSVLSEAEKNKLWRYMVMFHRHLVASVGRRTDPQDRADRLYTVLKDETKSLEHLKNEIADDVEFRKKRSEMIKMFTNDDNKFFYCTSHKNCARGHLDYQGRFYYKRGRKYSEEEKEFIRDHNLMAVEDVVLEPIWLTTRKNCRHRLIEVSFDEVQGGHFSDVKMTPNTTYEDQQYAFYRDRYKLLLKLKKEYKDKGVELPSQMKKDMKRTRLLMIQWNRARKKSK